MKIAFWLLIMLSYHIACKAQPSIDSLRKVLNNNLEVKSVEGKSRTLSYLGYAFYNEKQYDSALHYYYRVLGHKSIITAPSLASTYNSIGAIYSATGFPDSSLNYYKEALRLFSQLQDTVQGNEVQSNIIIIYKDIGLYEESLMNAFDLLTRLKDLPPGRILASCYNTIAIVYEKTGDLQLALQFHKRALAIRKEMNALRNTASSYNNIGITFHKLGILDSATAYLSKALAVKKEINDKRGSASTLNNMGEVLMDRNSFKEAERYFQESLEIKRVSNDRDGIVVTLNNLAALKLKEHSPTQAIVFLKEAEKIAREAKSLDELRQTLQLYMEVYKIKGDHLKALTFADELFKVKDSLLTAEKAKGLRALEIKYETEKKEQHIAMLEQRDEINQAEILNKQILIKALSVGLFLLIVIAILIYKYLRIERKSKTKIETLHSELHHRVKNNLQILSSVLSLQAEHMKDESAIQAVKSSESRINAMALIHRKLYNVVQNRSINIRSYITELIQYLSDAYGFNENELTINNEIEELQIDVDKAIPLGLILNELISNSFKYAYVDNPSPQLNISLKHQKSKVYIEIGDNGKGIAEHSIKKDNSFGIKMVHMLMKELRGNLTVKADAGTTYALNIPLN